MAEEESKSIGQMAKDVASRVIQHIRDNPREGYGGTSGVKPDDPGAQEAAEGVNPMQDMIDLYRSVRDVDPGLALAAGFGIITPFSGSQAKAGAKALREFITGKKLGPNPDPTKFRNALEEFVEADPESTQAILAGGDEFLGSGDIQGMATSASKELLPGGGPKPGTLDAFLHDAQRTPPGKPGGPYTQVKKSELEAAATGDMGRYGSQFMEDNPDFATYLKSPEYREGIPYAGKPVDMDVEDMADSRLLSPSDKRTEGSLDVSKEEAMELRRQMGFDDFGRNDELPPVDYFKGAAKDAAAKATGAK